METEWGAQELADLYTANSDNKKSIPHHGGINGVLLFRQQHQQTWNTETLTSRVGFN